MRSAVPLPPIAPSSALLRFLKSQSESICFFSSNPRAGFTFDHTAPRGRLLPSRRTRSLPRAGGLSRTSETPQIFEARLGNFDFLFPRATTRARNDRSGTIRIATRGKALNYAGNFSGQRSNFTDAQKSARRSAFAGAQKWHQKLWGSRGGKPLRPDDLPTTMYGSEETGDTSMFSLGRHISAKAAAQPKLRCTELDENGNVSMASGEFKKSELIAKVRMCKMVLHTDIC